MNRTTAAVLGAALMLVMIAASDVSAQVYVGATAGYTINTSSRNDVSAYGEPSRFFYGGRVVMPVRRRTELAIGLGLRQEDGGFLSSFVKNVIPRGNGIVDVVDNPGSRPTVVSSLTTTAIELNASLRVPLAQIDSSGSYVGLHLGALVDYLTSARQEDDYTRILQGDRGQIPDRVSTNYGVQFGGGATFGGVLALKTDFGRLVLELSYILRRPETITVPTPRIGGPQEQYIGWLVGNGLRLSAGFELGL